MLVPTATNFGVNPSDISFRYYKHGKGIILNGRFTVDATDVNYLAAGVLRLTFQDLGIGKTHETAVYVLNTKDGAHDVTVTKAWFDDGETLCIMPVLEYEALGEYTICFLNAFISVNVTGEVSLPSALSITPSVTRGALESADVQCVKSIFWAMLAMTAASLTFDDTEEDIVVSLPALTGWNLDFLPVIYTGNISDTYGSKFYPATLQNGVLTISKDGVTGDTGTTFLKFIRVFIAVDVSELNSGSDE